MIWILIEQKILEVYEGANYLAPEFLRGEIDLLESDVYSFGIIMWEIFNNKIAYGGNICKKTFVKDVIGGKRPETLRSVKEKIQKSNEPNTINYLKLMLRCWSEDPDDRPTFQSIVQKLKSCSDRTNSSFSTRNKSSNLNKYIKKKILGHGGQATVYLCVEKVNGKKFAWKRFHEDKISEMNTILSEMRAYVNLNHPSIMKILDFFISDIDQEGM